MTVSRLERRRSPRPGRHLPPWQVDVAGVKVTHRELWVALLFWTVTWIGRRRESARILRLGRGRGHRLPPFDGSAERTCDGALLDNCPACDAARRAAP